MQVTEIVRQLRERLPAFGRRVSGGIDWDAVADSTHLAGLRAHVVLTDENADPSTTQGVVMQDVDEMFDVVVEIPVDRGDEQGLRAADQVPTIRRALFLALVGWVPAENYDPIQYRGRELLVANRAKSVYRFSFLTGYRIGRNDQTQPPETWQEHHEDGCPPLEGIDLAVDFIDPMVDPNLAAKGPDGRIEIQASGELTQ